MHPQNHYCANRWLAAGRDDPQRRFLRIVLGLGALTASLAAIAFHIIDFDPAFAQGGGPARLGDCIADGAEFSNPPEIRHSGGFLRGSIFLSEERQGLPEAETTAGNTNTKCRTPVVRNFRPAPPEEPRNRDALFDPMPGPTLRARVGDLVQLTFVNQIDPGRFESARDLDKEACTPTGNLYPAPFGDEFPNCLHASSTANIHFHGTHTNPNSTGDNVYLQIRPLPRKAAGELDITAAQATVGFADFFQKCTEELKQRPLKSWPAKWSDLPTAWTEKQKELLMAYQQANPTQPLWSENEKVLLEDGWPVYYIGAFPYCFALPSYTADDWPPPAHSTSPMMGQSPGTHWYHAHKHGSTAINVMNGMTGAFIIEGKYDDDLNEAYGNYLLRDEGVLKPWSASDARSQKILVLNQLGTSPNARFGPNIGSGRQEWVDFSVNGRLRPKLKMQPGEVQLWRIVNTSGRTAAYFMPPDFMGSGGLTWRQIAQDGVQFIHVNYEKSENRPFYMAPANRVDLLVKAPMDGAGKKFPVRIQNVMSRDGIAPIPLKPAEEVMPGIDLLIVEVEGRPPMRGNQEVEMPFLGNTTGTPKFPEQPKFLRDISPEELLEGNDIKRTLVFNSKAQNPVPKVRPGPRQHTINELQFGDEHAHLDIALGAVEEWTIKNTTNTLEAGLNSNIDHPLHIHINPFQVSEFFDPNEKLIDATGKLETVTGADGKTKPVLRYILNKNDLVPKFAEQQCFIDPDDKATWSESGARSPRQVNGEWKFTEPCKTQAWPEWQSVWWDVFAIPSGRQISKGNVIPGFYKMRSRFVDYPGLYVTHCHILIHEDRGMMYRVEVLRQAPRPHH